MSRMDDRSARERGLELLVDSSRGSLFNVVGDAKGVFERIETELHGEAGWLAVPGFDGDAVGSFTVAISQLLAAAKTGRHPLDVHFGRDVVAILAAAEGAAWSGQTTAMPAR